MKAKIKKHIKNILSKSPTFFYKLNAKDITNNFNWLNELIFLYNKYFKFCPIEIFLKNYIMDLNNIINNNQNEKEFLNYIIVNFKKLDSETKMFLLNILYLSGHITDEIVQEYMKCAKESNDENFIYWFTMVISRITFRLQKGFYDNYYVDRKMLLKQICEECNFNIPIKKEKSKSNKLCIVTYCLEPTIFNSVQRVAMMLSKGLNKYYDEIMIISLDSFAVTKREKNLCIKSLSRPSAKTKQKEIKSMFEKNIKISFINMGNYKERYQEALNIIYDYNPSAILDMSDEYSIISYYYSKDFTTFYLPLRNYISSSFFNYILERKWYYQINDEQMKKLNIDINCMCDWSLPEYVPKCEKVYLRKDINIPENSFVIMTIGNNAGVIDNVLSDKMCKLLYENNKMVWLLVGENAPEYIHNKYDDLLISRQIIEWGFEKDLAGLCKIGNIVLRPNTTGSSGATAIAVQQGLPVVMTNFVCDPMRWLGLDYSNIDNYDDLMQEILRLYNDKVYYKEKKKIILEKINEATNEEKSWKELANIINNKTNMER